MNKKHKPRYLGPYILREPKTSGTWSINELDGTPSRTSVAGFRILPYIARDQRTIDQLANMDEEDSESDSDDEENEVPDTWDSDEDMIEQDDDFEVDDEDW
jgi:hypothetical protein